MSNGIAIELFFRNDIDWRTTPSNHTDVRFKELALLVSDNFRTVKSAKFKYKHDIDGLLSFIGSDFSKQSDIQGIEITLANLSHVFNDWCEIVKPTIAMTAAQWANWKKQGVYPSDFFIADAYVGCTEDATLIDSLKVVIHGTTYMVKLCQNTLVLNDEQFKQVKFNDKGSAYRDFWKRYKRPPRRVRAYESEKTPWEQILNRRDILVPRDIMERKGAFFTPRIWVEKAHEYLADALGENWQDEYVVYDCAAGSGNLLSGLYNQKNIFASDIDEQNIRIMTEETKPTFASNIFQFDFLNDDFIRQSKCLKCGSLFELDVTGSSRVCSGRFDLNGKLHKNGKIKCDSVEGGKVPDALMDILECPEKCKRLVFLINPPYAEAGDANLKGNTKDGITDNKVKLMYSEELSKASNELFCQFFARVYGEFKGCILAEFSKLKILSAPNFAKMREWFKPQYLGGFVVCGGTFDNVKGKFPIGFKLWDTGVESDWSQNLRADAYEAEGFLKKVIIRNGSAGKLINDWLREYRINTTLGTDAGDPINTGLTPTEGGARATTCTPSGTRNSRLYLDRLPTAETHFNRQLGSSEGTQYSRLNPHLTEIPHKQIEIAALSAKCNDFQQQNLVRIANNRAELVNYTGTQLSVMVLK